MKQVIRMNARALYSLISESVRRIINEYGRYKGRETCEKVVEIDAGELFVNDDVLCKKYADDDDYKIEELLVILDKYIPTVEVFITYEYVEGDGDYYGPQPFGEWDLSEIEISETDSNELYQLEKDGLLPQGLVEELLTKIYNKVEEEV